MKRSIKLAVVVVAAAGGATAAGLTLPAAIAGGAPDYAQRIYSITVSSTGPAGVPVDTPEWVSLATGTWRAELEGQTFVSSDDDYVVIDDESGSVYHRTGSPSFMRGLHTPPEGVVALQAYLDGDPTLGRHGLHLAVGKGPAGKTKLDVLDAAGKRAFSVTIDARVTDEQAARAHLLDARPVQAHVTDAELPVGRAPAGDLTAYWFGPNVDRWHAAAAAQHSLTRTPAQVAAGMSARSAGQVHVTFYERPGNETTSAQPGLLNRPDGELQVTSEPVASAHAQGLVDAFDGTNGDETYPAWPRTTLTLANGEQAIVVPNQFDGAGAVRPGFFVITGSTLVSVAGDVPTTDIPALAAKLRPVG